MGIFEIVELLNSGADMQVKQSFKNDLTKFIERLKSDSQKYEGDTSFERFMKGLSDGTVQFRWQFGGRLTPSYGESDDDQPNMELRYLASAPFIYAMVLPIAFLDLSVSLYQAICFRLWKIPQISRSKHVVVDRHYLSYLKPYQKFNCAYCGYATGVIAYARSIAAATEKYWCPLKHKDVVEGAHEYYIEFADYNDEAEWAELQEKATENTNQNAGQY